MGAKRGFTLIELLVVIAIIAILAFILFPVFAKAKKESHKTVCIMNLKQLYNAVLAYSSDYSGSLPAMVEPWYWDWDREPNRPYFMHVQLGPYIRDTTICSCPAWKAIEDDGDSEHRNTWGPNGYSWALPDRINESGDKQTFSNGAFPNPHDPASRVGDLAMLIEPSRYGLINCNSPNDHSGYGDQEVLDENRVQNLACMRVCGDGHTEMARFYCGDVWGDLNIVDSMGWRLWWNGGYPNGERAFADQN